jgi:hypothetical protein
MIEDGWKDRKVYPKRRFSARHRILLARLVAKKAASGRMRPKR